jgi:hypothetical protein
MGPASVPPVARVDRRTAGAYPYQAIVAPARDSLAARRATWAAIDLAARAAVPLEAMGVVPPALIERA